MAGPDLLLLHPPSLWDFRTRPRLSGPVSDLVPSSPVFEMYPIGFVSIADFLVKNGVEVRITNLAVKMLKSSRYDPEKFIKNQSPKIFGIDLHWLPHAHGAIAAANVAKTHHPEIPVVLGGLSATYFHKELIEGYPSIDFVLRGDSTERPILKLLETIEKDGDLSQVPNLTWRGPGGKVRVNKDMDIPLDLEHLSFDYDVIIKKIMKYRDIQGHMPTPNWKKYPITAVMTVRGCTHGCKTCGGSCQTYSQFHGRSKPVFRSPKNIVADIAHISTILKGPIFIIGDLRQGGDSYASKILKGIKGEKVPNEIVIELFNPAPSSYFKEISRSVDLFNLSLSPESHDQKVRAAQGRHYDNSSIRKSIQSSFKAGCRRFDLYFMIGLPKQGPESPIATVGFSKDLMLENKGNELHCYISPLAPFLDPGSPAFEEPKRYGYSLKAKDLESHRILLTLPSWKLALNYHTSWLSADQLVKSTYQAADGMNDAKLEAGLVEPEDHSRIRASIEASMTAVAAIDEIHCLKDPSDKASKLKALKDILDKASQDILVGKGELEWPAKGIKYRGVLKSLFKKNGRKT